MLFVYLLLHFRQLHSILPESVLSSLLYIRDSLHGLNRADVKVTIILDWLIPLLLKLKHRVFCDLFIMNLPIGLSPCQFSRVVFGFEMSVAFRTTESEIFTIIPDKQDSMPWVNRAWTEVTSLNPHSTI